jgi:hypothetical protein
MSNDFGLSSLKMTSSFPTRDILVNHRDYSGEVSGAQYLRRQESINIFDNDTSCAPISFDSFEIEEERRWENLVHPYLIVNADGHTLTFIGTYLHRSQKLFYNPNTDAPLATSYLKNVPQIPSELFIELLKQRLNIFDNFNSFIKAKKIVVLSNIMGIGKKANQFIGEDSESDYELTLDNVLKMVAIYFRFQCDIP